MSDVPRSERFDDVYFSVSDGYAETRHVFLEGNGLPDAWVGRDEYVICETGFGTGLNFLAVLELWQSCAEMEQGAGRAKKLHFISFEKYPLDGAYIERHLSRWGVLENQLASLLSVYPSDLSQKCCHLELGDDVSLSLYFGDVNDVMPTVDGEVDCWFLDGFKPSSNADMWSDLVFENMARLSCVGANFATFTVAGFVRRGLVGAGFDVRKVRGFGRKREMCVGVYTGEVT